MSAAAFAYVLVLRGDEAKDELMTLLSQDRHADVQAVLEKIKDLSAEQIREQLTHLREEQLNRQRGSAKERIGLQADHVSPKLCEWLTRPF
jgi:hypothetical protein